MGSGVPHHLRIVYLDYSCCRRGLLIQWEKSDTEKPLSGAGFSHREVIKMEQEHRVYVIVYEPDESKSGTHSHEIFLITWDGRILHTHGFSGVTSHDVGHHHFYGGVTLAVFHIPMPLPRLRPLTTGMNMLSVVEPGQPFRSQAVGTTTSSKA